MDVSERVLVIMLGGGGPVPGKGGAEVGRGGGVSLTSDETETWLTASDATRLSGAVSSDLSS